MSQDEEPAAYDNSHRAFLQAFLARSVLTFEEAKPILAAILTARDRRRTLPNDIQPADLNTYLTTLNAALSKFDFEIRSTYPQTTTNNNNDSNTNAPQNRERIYALVNTTSDSLTQLATTHSADAIAFVKRLLDEMFETNNTARQELCAVSGMRAVQLRTANSSNSNRTSGGGASFRAHMNGDGEESQAQTQGTAGSNLTLKAAEEVLASMVAEGWFSKSRKGFYTLTPRALMELRGWLVETYNETTASNESDDEDEVRVQRIKFCEACREVVTIGQRCSDRDCGCRFHDYCAQGFFAGQREKKCPTCETEWTGRDFVGERAAAPGSARGSMAGPSRTSNGTGRRRETIEVDDNDEEDDDDED